jgi:hypothetical protein
MLSGLVDAIEEATSFGRRNNGTPPVREPDRTTRIQNTDAKRLASYKRQWLTVITAIAQAASAVSVY